LSGTISGANSNKTISREEHPILNNIFIDAVLKDVHFPCSFIAETSKDTIFSKEYFSKPNTKDDIFLATLGEVWLSKYYFSKDHPLQFVSNYIIKLEKVNDSMTKIRVIADQPMVINGTDCCGPHGQYARFTPVSGTSIEEYTLLEFIASRLGDTTLVPIKLPEDTKTTLSPKIPATPTGISTNSP